MKPVAFWDRTVDRARDLAAHYPGARAFGSITELVRVIHPRLVDIATHPAARWSVIEEALDAGAEAFIIEKPIALTPEELAKIEVAGETRFMAVNTQYRWMDHWEAILALVAEGGIGAVQSITASTATHLLEQGPHLMSLALAASRAAGLPEPEWVRAGAGRSAASSLGDDGDSGDSGDLVAVAGMGNARLIVTAGAASPSVPGEDVFWYQQQLRIAGDRGQVWVSLNQGWSTWTTDGMRSGPTAWPHDDIVSQAAFLRDVSAAVLDPRLQERFPTRISVSSAEARILFGTLRSAERGLRVQLS